MVFRWDIYMYGENATLEESLSEDEEATETRSSLWNIDILTN